MLGSKFPGQEVAWEGALVYVCVSALLCVCVFVCVYEPGQCVRDQKIRPRERQDLVLDLGSVPLVQSSRLI